MLYNDAASTEGEPVESVHSAMCGMPYNPKGRKANAPQAVGWPDSTDETAEMRRREAEKGLFLITLPRKAIPKRKHGLYPEIGENHGNEIGENITTIKRKPRHGVYVYRTSY